MAFKEFMVGKDEYLFDSGYITNNDLSNLFDIDEDLITEEATHSWYEDDEALHPYDGKTNPKYTGFVDGQSVGPDGEMIDSKNIDSDGKYSWIKSPRYDGKSMEVGPLACLLVSYARGNEIVKDSVNGFLKETGLPVGALFTTLGRTAARALQCEIIADNAIKAFNNLVENLKVDQETCAPYVIDKNKEYKGRGIGDVPTNIPVLKSSLAPRLRCLTTFCF